MMNSRNHQTTPVSNPNGDDTSNLLSAPQIPHSPPSTTNDMKRTTTATNNTNDYGALGFNYPPLVQIDDVPAHKARTIEIRGKSIWAMNLKPFECDNFVLTLPDVINKFFQRSDVNRMRHVLQNMFKITLYKGNEPQMQLMQSHHKSKSIGENVPLIEVKDLENFCTQLGYLEHLMNAPDLDVNSIEYESEDQKETNKNKRKYVSSSEDDPHDDGNNRRRKINNETITPQLHPDENKKEKFEAIVEDAVTVSAVIRELLSKKEAKWKKNYFNADAAKLSETVQHSNEEFLTSIKVIETAVNMLKELITDRFEALKSELSKNEENPNSRNHQPASVSNPSAYLQNGGVVIALSSQNTTNDMKRTTTVTSNANDYGALEFNYPPLVQIDDVLAYKARPIEFKGNSIWAMNLKPFEFNNYVLTLSDVINLFFPRSDVNTMRHVLQNMFKMTLYKGNKPQMQLMRRHHKGISLDEEVPLIEVKDLENFCSHLGYLKGVIDVNIKEQKSEDQKGTHHVSWNSANDVSLKAIRDDSPTKSNVKPFEADKSKSSIGDSLAANVSTGLRSSDDKNELRNQNNSAEELDSIHVDMSEPDHETKNDSSEVVISEVVVTESTLKKESVFDENNAKMSLLKSPSDDNTTDDEKFQNLATVSKLSGVEVLYSDQEDVNKTKHKKMKTRKKLNSLIKKEPREINDEDREIKRLGDFKGLEKRKARYDSDSDDEETEKITKKRNRSSSKKKKIEKASLISFFGEGSGNDTDGGDGSNVPLSNFDSALENKNGSFLNGIEDMSKKMLLDSSEDEKVSVKSSDDDVISAKLNEKPSKSSPKKSPKLDKKTSSKNLDSGDESLKKRDSSSSSDDFRKCTKKDGKSGWRLDRLLKSKLSETDTSDDERLIKRETGKRKRTDKTPSKKKRSRINISSDSDNNSDENSDPKINPGSASKGRRNIKKILKDKDLTEATKQTVKKEEARKKRIAERQAIFNESSQIEEDINKTPNKLVLDFDLETKKEIIAVHEDLVKKLKPHQAKGVKFMWDSCFESTKMTKTTPGGGCILAHCMGLGKTLQVITLIHTLMRYPQLKMQRVLVLCPLSTVLNWIAEFDKWLQDMDDGDDIDIIDLNKTSSVNNRADILNNWFKNGGVMVMGYDMFRILVNNEKAKNEIKDKIIESLLEPGPDLVVCDEGHILKSEQTAISQATMKIKTKRRIVLTGTPLQNNLSEYHCMVQFVKQNLLGDKKEFQNRFANPITNGQYSDSTVFDVTLMKQRSHVLHKMLDGVVQRFGYNVLTPFLPSKHEFVILVGLSDLQAKLYEYYIDHYSKKVNSGSTLFKDFQIMRLIWTHPYAMKLREDRKRNQMKKKIKHDEDSEGSLRAFVVGVDESKKTSDSDSDRSDESVNSKSKTETRPKDRSTCEKEKESCINDAPTKDDHEDVWWQSMVTEEEINDYKMGPKLVLLFAIIQHCENIGDKVLVFSESLPSLDMIEYFLEKWQDIQQIDKSKKSANQYATWEKGVDYFRLDGQTDPKVRRAYCNCFNKTSNTRSRLFLISTKAGGLGINLTGANRVIILDASWNPSYNVQSIFRVYRFGQNKQCFIYRLLSQGTMEEKIYERQVTKLSISCRVIDEQQIDRHYNNADINALYHFNRKKPSEDEVPKLPKDRLMAEVLKEYKHAIVSYHEHDSLLEDQKEEELTEEERKQAWNDYENEKKGPKIQVKQEQQSSNVRLSQSSDSDSDVRLSPSSDSDSNVIQVKPEQQSSNVRLSQSSDSDSDAGQSQSSDSDSNVRQSKSSDSDSNVRQSQSSNSDSNARQSKSSDSDSNVRQSKSSDSDSNVRLSPSSDESVSD